MGGLKPLASAALAKRVPPGVVSEWAPKEASFSGMRLVRATVWQIWHATQVLQWLPLPSATASLAVCIVACSGQSTLSSMATPPPALPVGSAKGMLDAIEGTAARLCIDISTDIMTPAQPRAASKAIIRNTANLRIFLMIPLAARSSALPR